MQSLVRPIARPAVASRFMRAAWAPAARGVRPLTQSRAWREPASAAQAASVEAEVAATPARARPSPTGMPLNIKKWVEENGEKLAPPVNNYCVYDGSGVTVMIVGGPNQRTDYHINETPEWFYQHKGTMVLRVKDMSDPAYGELGQGFDIRINEGDMYLLPPNTPHNPVRFKDTVGIVIEQGRPEDSIDKLRWYCNSCGESIVHEASFHCTDLGTQIKDGVRKFEALDERSRTCKSCGTVCESKYNEDDLAELQRGGPAYCYKH